MRSKAKTSADNFESRARMAAENLGHLPALDFARAIVAEHPEAGFFLVGGAVRDAILGRPSKDLDLVASGIKFSHLIPELLKYGRVVFDLDPEKKVAELSPEDLEALFKKGFGVLKFYARGSKDCIDIALPRTDNHEKKSAAVKGIKRDVFAQADPTLPIEEDLARRDFTINAMAVNLASGKLVDPFGGLDDLENHQLKAVGKPADRILEEDLSRAFRGLRFAVQLGLKIEPRTLRAIKMAFEPEGDVPRCWQKYHDHATGKIKTAVAPEVASEQFIKALRANPVAMLDLWDEAGALKVLSPEVLALKNIPQPPEFHSEGDAYAHTRLLLEKLPVDADIKLKLAGLLHDIGKAVMIQTPEKDGTDRIRFNGHDQAGATMAAKIMRRLKLPKNISEPVAWAIEHHMLPLTSYGETLKKSTLRKYFFREDGWGDLLLDLVRYDAAASIGPAGQAEMNCYETIKAQIDTLERETSGTENDADNGARKNIPAKVSGADLIKIFKLKPGPRFKEILETAMDYQLEHPRADKEEIIEYLRTQI